MNSRRLLLTCTEKEEADFFPADLRARLAGLAYDVEKVYLPLKKPAEWPHLLRESNAEVLLSCWKTPPLPSDIPVGREGALRYVCHVNGTVRELIPRVLLERGLRVTNWGSSISRTVAEHALLLILSALRRSSYWAVAMHGRGLWKDAGSVTQSLFGRTVGIHGFGLVARELTRLLVPFGVSVSSFSPGTPEALFAEKKVRSVASLEELFLQNEVVVCLAPGIPENRHIVTEKLLRLIRPGGVFVNVGRGLVVDEAAIVRVAREENIQIALDVYEAEPLSADSPLRGLPNIMLTPHIGGPTNDRRRDCGEFALANLERYLLNQPLEAEMTPEIYDAAS